MTDETTNFLSDGITITGEIRFRNNMRIDGKINGEIKSESGKVIIGQTAVITGNIQAGEVSVIGDVNGNISSNRCELKSQAKVKGDIVTRKLSMEEGASLSGHTEIG